MKKLMFAIAVMAAGAAMAVTIAYQGALKNADGSAVSGGSSLPITFRLYNTPTTDDSLLWVRTVNVLLNDEGVFNVELSDNNGSFPSNSPTNTLDNVLATYTENLFIGLEVEGSTGEIRPRQKLLSVPMAAYAQDVSKAKNNFEVTGHANVCNGLDVTGNAVVTGNVYVARTLEVEGDAKVAGALKVTGETELSGNVKLVNGVTLTAENGANLVQDGAVGGIIPRGGIIMWSGSVTNIPNGWALCNGSDVTYNGKTTKTPDLRGCFIVGASESNKADDRGTIKDKDGNRIVSTAYAVGNVGGEENHSLAESEMPAHMHLSLAESLLNDKFGTNDSWKQNKLRYQVGRVYAAGSERGDHPGGLGYQWHSSNDQMTILETGRTGGDGTKTTTDDKEGQGYAALGHAKSHENRPPYYALCFIIKL